LLTLVNLSRQFLYTDTLQGVRIPSGILRNVFRHILFLFLFLMQFRLRRAAAFVSSPIHLFCLKVGYVKILIIWLWNTTWWELICTVLT